MERLRILSAASGAADASSVKARGAVAAAMRLVNPQERKKRIAVFLKEQGILGRAECELNNLQWIMHQLHVSRT